MVLEKLLVSASTQRGDRPRLYSDRPAPLNSPGAHADIRIVAMDLGTSAALAVVVLLIASPAYAYIDPGGGGMLVQLLTSGAAGALILARLYWRRVKDRLTPKSPAAEQTVPADTSGLSPTDRR
jgi:hypothetical protein